ncbi:Ig-like domain-containing protein [Reichenbachiella sp.]|uniref:Ig-like domain-containing protein n=1 Tax=Reichenbachiella sp. TaxID=2184521 RepID=UPI003B5B14A4
MKNHFFSILILLTITTILVRCTEDDPEIKITSMTFDAVSVEVVEGTTVDLNDYLIIEGEDADQAIVSFTTSNDEVVTVSGVVLSAVGVGTAQIVATEVNTDLTATIDVTVISKVIAVTGISLDKSEADLKVGEELQLTATITPDDATEKGVTWSVSFPSEAKKQDELPTDIATVSEEGLVTAVAAGSVVVTAASKEGDFSASATITITSVAVTGITLSASSLSVNIGETGSLEATISPENATNKNVVWTLTEDEGSPETYASVDAETGVVTGISECDACGLALVATTEDGDFTAVVDLFVVYVPVTGITIDPSSFSVEAGETQQLVAMVEPTNASNKNVTWSVRFTSFCDAIPEDYATVSATGLVTGVSPEICDLEIRATAENETRTFGTAFVDVTVTATSVTIVDDEELPFAGKSISLDYIESSMQLYLAFTPSNATNTLVTWESDDSEAIDVSDTGLLSGLSSSTARITVTLNDGSGLSDYVDVSFFEP